MLITHGQHIIHNSSAKSYEKYVRNIYLPIR